MKRILLVEDQPITLRNLSDFLRLRFAGVVVDPAANEDEARELLAGYVRDGKRLDAAVLDIMVPRSKGTSPIVSTLCEDVRRRFPGAIIGHITAHVKDGPVWEHLARSDHFCINKTDEPEWEAALVRRLVAAKIENALDAMAPERSSTVLRGVGLTGRHQGATYRRADLILDITRYWKLLEPPLQSRIRKHFGLGDDDEPVAL